MTRGVLLDYNASALRSDCMIFAASVAQDMYNISGVYKKSSDFYAQLEGNCNRKRNKILYIL